MGPTHKPRLWAVGVRIVLITALATLVTFAVGLFVGITSTALLNFIRGGEVNMADAYRHIALPAATVAMVVSFIMGARNELIEYRRACSSYLRGQSRAA
jgi:hypothetical protein